jgi:hypothetical protein
MEGRRWTDERLAGMSAGFLSVLAAILVRGA